MNGDNTLHAQQQCDNNSILACFNHQGGALVKMQHKCWPIVGTEMCASPALTFVWAPGAIIHCLLCKHLFHVKSKHFCKNCHPCLAVKKSQQGLIILHQNHRYSKVHLNLELVEYLLAQGLHLKDVHSQECMPPTSGASGLIASVLLLTFT